MTFYFHQPFGERTMFSNCQFLSVIKALLSYSFPFFPAQTGAPTLQPPWVFVTAGKGGNQNSLWEVSRGRKREELWCADFPQMTLPVPELRLPPPVSTQASLSVMAGQCETIWETTGCPRDCCRLCCPGNDSLLGVDSLQARMKTADLRFEKEKARKSLHIQNVGNLKLRMR